MAATATGPLTEQERAELFRFIRVLDYEKHSGAEHNAVRHLKRLWNAHEHSMDLLQRIHATVGGGSEGNLSAVISSHTAGETI